VPFPFVERDEERVRPALIVSNGGLGKDGRLFWSLMITSAKGREPWPDDIPIGSDHMAYGLPVPCLIRTAKLSTLSLEAIERKLGRLPDPLLADVRRQLASRLSL
jgi:mRNA-degrading endonuclease toxin of MazEF toxin-antitoxin module